MTHLDRLLASCIIALLTLGIVRELEYHAREKAQAPPIVVSVTGAVSRPGVIQLPADSRAIHAIALCGGVTERADREALELARPLIDGEHLSVPESMLVEVPLPAAPLELSPDPIAGLAGESKPSAFSSASVPRPSPRRTSQRATPKVIEPSDDPPRRTQKSATKVLPSSPIDINTASVEDLLTLPGIGPKTAQRIIESRQTEHSGTFTSLEDLATIRGIKGKMLSRLRPYLKIEGS